jgi:hypothetical protein
MYETWEDILSNNDRCTNRIFNNFLSTFLRKLHDCFTKKKKQKKIPIPEKKKKKKIK